jgi:hypothetical protein
MNLVLSLANGGMTITSGILVAIIWRRYEYAQELCEKANRTMELLDKLYGDAVELQGMGLPKTFPDNIYPVHEFPGPVQRDMITHIRKVREEKRKRAQ